MQPPTEAEIAKTYDIRVGELRRHGVGWESAGWTDGVWFVKVWRDRAPENLAHLEQIRLDVPIPIAVRARDGRRCALTDSGAPFGVFPFFPGRPATDDDAAETGRVLRLVHDHAIVDLPTAVLREDAVVGALRSRLDHPWIRARRSEVEAYLDRFEALVEQVVDRRYEPVLLHTDFGGSNLLVDVNGRASAILDWDQACIGPRELDVWIAFEHNDPVRLLRAYGAQHLDVVLLEYALLRRAVQDLAARVVNEEDRDGVDRWGFARWRRLDADLASAAPFLA